jgi:hypothetical protein
MEEDKYLTCSICARIEVILNFMSHTYVLYIKIVSLYLDANLVYRLLGKCFY